MDSNKTYGFQEDSKKYRKLRKILRQIEHLQLLARPLNDEEKHKCSKREYYRKELNYLNEKYANSQLLNELINQDNNNLSLQNEDSHLFLNNTEPDDTLSSVAREKNETNDKSLNSTTDELNAKLACLSIETATDKISNEEPSLIQKELGEPSSEKATSGKKKNKQRKQPAEQNSEPTSTKTESQQQKAQPKLKPKIFFDHLNVENCHEDIIVSIDISVESNLIVTGSRDTTIKVWNLNDGKLIHSFGGHTGSITHVKIWPYKSYLNSIENLKNKLNEDDSDSIPDFDSEFNKHDEDDEDSKDENREGKCVKQFYLYNPINSFDVSNTLFLIALDAGKVGYIENLKEICCPKILTDTDSVRCVKFLDNETNQFYGLTQSGNLILVKINNSQLELIKKVNIHSTMRKISSKFSQNFRLFELISNNKLLIINDNQSYVILYDLNKEDKFKLVSTNTTKYGFTNCLSRVDNQYFINSFNIDNGSSSINIFEYDSNETDLKEDYEPFRYKFTIQDEDLNNTYCISAIVCKRLEKYNNEKNLYKLVSASRRNLKIWTLQETCVLSNENKKDQAKFIRMCKEVSINSHEDDDDEEEEEDEDQSENKEKGEFEEPEATNKRSCLIQ